MREKNQTTKKMDGWAVVFATVKSREKRRRKKGRSKGL
jgi:hypothetical protein